MNQFDEDKLKEELEKKLLGEIKKASPNNYTQNQTSSNNSNMPNNNIETNINAGVYQNPNQNNSTPNINIDIENKNSENKKFDILKIKGLFNIFLFILFLLILIFTTYITTPIFHFQTYILNIIQTNYSYLNIVLISIIFQLVIYLIYFDIAIFLFPYISNETKKKILSPQPIILVIILVLTISYSFLTYNSNEPITTLTEQANKTSYTLKDSFENMICYLNPSCVEKKLNSKESENTKRNYPKIIFYTPYINGVDISLEQIKKKPIHLQYEFENIRNLKIEKIECYAYSVKKENLFFEKKLDISSKDQNFYAKINKEIYCDLKNFNPNLERENPNDVTIYPILYLSIIEDSSILIPVVFQNKIFDKLTETYPYYTKPLNYPDLKLRNFIINKYDKDVKIITTTNTIKINARNIKNSIPFIFENNNDDEIFLNFEISKNNYNDLGEIGNVSILDTKIDENYFNVISKEILKKSNQNELKYVINLDIKEKDKENFENIYEAVKYTKINIKLNVNFKNKNSFKFYLTDNFEKRDKEQKSSNLENNFENNNNNNNNLKYDELDTKLNELENKFYNIDLKDINMTDEINSQILLIDSSLKLARDYLENKEYDSALLEYENANSQFLALETLINNNN